MILGRHEMGPEEAAAALGITVEQLLERAGNGDIPQTKLDRHGWKFSRPTIAKMLERIEAQRAATAVAGDPGASP